VISFIAGLHERQRPTCGRTNSDKVPITGFFKRLKTVTQRDCKVREDDYAGRFRKVLVIHGFASLLKGAEIGV
jgi:hypothetical protein